MPYSARAIANYFIQKAKAEGRSLNPMQVQKLVYFAHGWYMAITGRPLIRESIEAWPYGPVVKDLFHQFKIWGSGAIERPAASDAGFLRHAAASLKDETDSESERAIVEGILDRVWEVYGRYSGVKLSELTHRSDSPWAETRRTHPGERDVPIPNELIRKYFTDRIEDESGGAAASH